jgi:drug/metabolite transporter (DMT)-like permease
MKGAYLRMHSAILLWGFTGVLGKFIRLNEGMLVWYRMLISAFVLFLVLLWRKSLPKLPSKKWIQLSAIGVVVMIHWVAFYGSIKLSSISVAMICLSSTALFASLLEPLMNRKKFDFTEILFSILAVVGISFIYFSDVSASTGILVGIFSAMLSAVFNILNQRIASDHEPLTISFIELGAGWLALTILLPIYIHIQPTTYFLPDMKDWFYLMILSIFCTVLTWILSLQALRKVSAYTMALSMNLEPVYGILLAILFANEGKVINGGFLTGAAIILTTVILHTWHRYKRSKMA